MIKIIVGCLIVKDNKFVIVKEAKKQVYGKWNLPLGHLEENEDILVGAKRESEEETGLSIEIKGFIGVYQDLEKNDILIIFEASTKDNVINFPKDELLDAKWISFDDFKKIPKNDIRVEAIIKAVEDYKIKGSLSLDYIQH